MAKLGNVGRLLDESLQSYYWLGFILADGSFSKNNTRLKVALGRGDYGHLEKFVNYLGKEYKSQYSGTFMDVAIVPVVYNKLGLHPDNPKMYYQPDILKYDEMSNEEFLALFISFIDGDGSIQYQTGRLTTKLSIKLHESWLAFLDYLLTRVYFILGYTYKSPPHINKENKVTSNISNFGMLKDLKLFVVENRLTALDRKWDKIDLNLKVRKQLNRGKLNG